MSDDFDAIYRAAAAYVLDRQQQLAPGSTPIDLEPANIAGHSLIDMPRQALLEQTTDREFVIAAWMLVRREIPAEEQIVETVGALRTGTGREAVLDDLLASERHARLDFRIEFR